ELNRAGNDEALPNFADYERLMSFIREARIDGVVFVTGDRHHAILMKQDVEGGYPLYDLTTSPLTAGIAQAREGTDHELVVPGTYFPERNFALLEFSGPRRERRLTIRIVNAVGVGVWERTVGEEDLKFASRE
ncbi:MAG: alkaline phosphatase family protein, partial [Thermoanaerobaculia bacterium]